MKYILKMGELCSKYEAEMDINKIREYYDLEVCDSVHDALALYAIGYGTRVRSVDLEDKRDAVEVWVTEAEMNELQEEFAETAMGEIFVLDNE